MRPRVCVEDHLASSCAHLQLGGSAGHCARDSEIVDATRRGRCPFPRRWIYWIYCSSRMFLFCSSWLGTLELSRPLIGRAAALLARLTRCADYIRAQHGLSAAARLGVRAWLVSCANLANPVPARGLKDAGSHHKSAGGRSIATALPNRCWPNHCADRTAAGGTAGSGFHGCLRMGSVFQSYEPARCDPPRSRMRYAETRI